MNADGLIDINSSINIQGGLYAYTDGNINVDQSISAGQVSLYAGGTLDVNNPISVVANSYHPNAFLNLFILFIIVLGKFNFSLVLNQSKKVININFLTLINIK